jgi:hypothetical protein
VHEIADGPGNVAPQNEQVSLGIVPPWDQSIDAAESIDLISDRFECKNVGLEGGAGRQADNKLHPRSNLMKSPCERLEC